MTAEKTGETAAATLAEALADYERYALRVESPAPDPSLDEARRRVALAKQIVDEGRISYALCCQLLEHISPWPTWIERKNFREYVAFDATDITAVREATEDKRHEKINVAFSFGPRRYAVVFTDKGYSAAPDSNVKFGHIALHVDERLVLAMDTQQELSEFASWWPSLVRVFDPGDWMQELLQISAQIETRKRAQRHAIMDDEIKEASGSIRLPEHVESSL